MRTMVSTFAVLIVVVACVAIVYGVTGRGALVEQPLLFNHAVHIDEAGAQCLDCHKDAESDTVAGLPGKEVCFDCHDIDEEADTHAEKDLLFAYYERDDDLPWGRVEVTRPDVYFSHRRHVTSAKMDCLECHPKQPTLTSPPQYASLVMTMDDCLACHEEQRASVDCLACHR